MTATVESCCTGNPKLSFPITIGTYPIQDIIVQQPMGTQPSAPSKNSNGFINPSVPDTSGAPSAPTITISNASCNGNDNYKICMLKFCRLKYRQKYLRIWYFLFYFVVDLPTYHEAVGEMEHSENNYKPKYPMFKQATSYSIGQISNV